MSPVITTANMVGVVVGVIAVARVVADMTFTTVAVHHPHPWIGCESPVPTTHDADKLVSF